MTKPICAICGRRTTPFVMLGTEPIGPKCAAKAGLTPSKNPRLKFTRAQPGKKTDSRMGDLFEGME